MATLSFAGGSIKGRVGQFVGSSWRGKDYIKMYTPPTYTNSDGQKAVRTIFQHTAHIAKAIYQGVLKPYTFPKPQKLTAYNRMIQINKAMFDDLNWDQTKLKIFDGPLFNPGITGATVEDAGSANVAVRVRFAGAVGEGTDIAFAIIHDEVTETTLYGQATRMDAQIDVPIATFDQTNLTKIHAYLVFAKPPAQPGGGNYVNGVGDVSETGQVSGTAYQAVPAP
jgi:hypothetical protein